MDSALEAGSGSSSNQCPVQVPMPGLLPGQDQGPGLVLARVPVWHRYMATAIGLAMSTTEVVVFRVTGKESDMGKAEATW